MLGYLCQLFYSQQSRILQCTKCRGISCSHNSLTYIRLLLRTFFYIIWSSKSFQSVTLHPSGLPQGPSQGPPPGPSSGSCTGRCTMPSVLRGPETTVCAGILRHVQTQPHGPHRTVKKLDTDVYCVSRNDESVSVISETLCGKNYVWSPL